MSMKTKTGHVFRVNDDSLTGSGWHNQELRDNGIPFRWSRSNAVACLPACSSGLRWFRVLASSLSEHPPRMMRVSINGSFAGEARLGSDRQYYTFRFHQAVGTKPITVEFVITPADPKYIPEGDPRTDLGICAWAFQVDESCEFDDSEADYAMSIYTGLGQRIGQRSGPLKFVLDPFMVYRNYPNQETASYTIDADGFRDGHVNEGAMRLAVVMGASVTFGYSLASSDQTFVSKLSRANPIYRFINAGVVGLMSGQALSQMVHYLDSRSPSMYLLMSGWNDVFDSHTFADGSTVTGGPVGFNTTFLTIGDRLMALQRIQRDDDNPDCDSLPPTPGPRSMEAYSKEVIDTYTANICRMAAFSQARGAKFLLVFQPELGSKRVRSEFEDETLAKSEIEHGYLRKQIPEHYRRLIEVTQDICKERGITCIDPNDIPSFTENPETLFFDSAHLNALGHSAIAQIIHEAMPRVSQEGKRDD